MKVEVYLPFVSRFKKNPLYTDGGKTFFGVWNRPEIKLDGDEQIITVAEHQVGQLDLLAAEEYDDRSLFWAIATVNNIRHPPDEVVAGLKLTIPKLENIIAALSDTSEVENYG